MCEEVTFVGGIDEDFGMDGESAEQSDGCDVSVFDADAIEVLAEDRMDGGVIEHGVDGVLGDVWLEVPFFGLAVMLSAAAVEFPGHAADDVLFAVVGPTESADLESADELSGVEQRDGVSASCGFDGGGEPGGTSAVDADIDVEDLVSRSDPVWIEVMEIAHGASG